MVMAHHQQCEDLRRFQALDPGVLCLIQQQYVTHRRRAFSQGARGLDGHFAPPSPVPRSVSTSIAVSAADTEEDQKSGSRVGGLSIPPNVKNGRKHCTARNHKTELCKNWLRDRSVPCPYRQNCQYAHGPEELRQPKQHPKHKTQRCNKLPNCPFGWKCHYIHPEDEVPAPVNPYVERFGFDSRAGGQADSMDFFHTVTPDPPKKPILYFLPCAIGVRRQCLVNHAKWGAAVMPLDGDWTWSPPFLSWCAAVPPSHPGYLSSGDEEQDEEASSSCLDEGYHSDHSTPRRLSFSHQYSSPDYTELDKITVNSWPEVGLIRSVLQYQMSNSMVERLLEL